MKLYLFSFISVITTLVTVQASPVSQQSQSSYLIQLNRKPDSKSFNYTKIRTNLVPKTLKKYIPYIKEHYPNSRILSGGNLEQTNTDPTDSSIYGSVIIGGQNFNLVLDTASSNLWVPSINCQDPNCAKLPKFDPSKSTTFSQISGTWKIQYNTGFANGGIGSDNLIVGNLPVTGQVFGLATTVSSDYVGVSYEGILGMAFDEINTLAPNALTPFSNLVQQKQVTNAIFGFHINRPGNQNDAGELSLGSVDTTKFIGELKYIPLTKPNNGLWSVNMNGINVGNNPISGAQIAIIDTGTVSIIGPLDMVNAIFTHIPGSVPIDGGYFSIPCNTTQVVTFVLGGNSFDLNTKDLIFSNSGSGNCVSSIVSHGVSTPGLWILGEFFFRSFYVAFDVANKAVGLAPSAVIN